MTTKTDDIIFAHKREVIDTDNPPKFTDCAL